MLRVTYTTGREAEGGDCRETKLGNGTLVLEQGLAFARAFGEKKKGLLTIVSIE